MLTTPANAFIRPLPDRIPVIVPMDRYGAWLDEDSTAWRKPLAGVLEPTIREYPVTPYLTGRGADGPECITPE